MTRNKAVLKGKEVEDLKKAEDPGAKVKLFRAQAHKKKKKNYMSPQEEPKTDAPNKKTVELISTPQPELLGAVPKSKSPITASKSESPRASSKTGRLL